MVGRLWRASDLLSARGPVLAAGVGAAGHVSNNRADVGVGPQSPVQGHVRAGGGRGVELGRLGAGVALHVDGSGVLYGAVARDGAGNSLRLKRVS